MKKSSFKSYAPQARKDFIGTVVTRINLMWRQHTVALFGEGATA